MEKTRISDDNLRLRYWTIYISEKSPYARAYRANRELGVVAPNLKAAIDEAMRLNPDAIIVSATYKGPVDVLQSDVKEDSK